MTSLALACKLNAARTPTSLALRALAAIRRAGGTVLAAGAATPVLGAELLPSTNLTNWVSGGAFGNWGESTATADTITASGPSGSRRVRLACTPGTTFWFSSRVTGGTASGFVAIAFGTSAAALISVAQSSIVAAGVVSTVAEAPANAAFVEFIVRGGTTGQTTSFADFRTGVFSGYTYGNPPVRNYFDSAGTDILDSVTQVDQPVGLTLDAAGTVGPNFVTTPIVTGAAVDGVTAVLPYQVGVGMTVGKTYQGTYTVSGFAGTLDVGFASGSFAAVTGATRVSANGTYTFIGTAVNPDISVFTRPISNTANFSNISVRELPGNHATQPTIGSKPTLRRGLVNQLLWSGDFGNAAWTKTGATVSTGQPDPNGGTSGFKLVESATSSQHYFLQNAISGSGAASAAYIVKASGRTKVRIRSEGPQTFGLATNFNLSTVSIQSGSGSIADLGNGFYLCVANSTGNGNGASGYHLIQPTDDSWNETYLGDGVSGILIYRAAIYQGTVTAQQILAAGGIPLTTTAPASSALGNYWWQFDPTAPGDYLQTAITTGNEGWVCAGVNFDNSAIQSVVSTGAGSASEKGIFPVLVNTASGGPFVQAQLGNGTTRTQVSTTMPINTPCVVSMGWGAAGVFSGCNSVEASPVAFTGDATGPNQMRIGVYRDGVTLPLKGPMPAIVICPTLPPPADRALIRAWVAKQQGQTL